jgi:hypothetical protein
MKIATDKEFCAHASELIESEEPVFITRNGETTGVYLPLKPDELSMELRKQLAYRLSDETRRDLEARGITEEQVIAEFKAARKTRS